MSDLHPVARELFALLETRKGQFADRPEHKAVDKYEHALQCASRAARLAEPDYYVMMCLFHDVFGGFSAHEHGALAAKALMPFLDRRAVDACSGHEEAMQLILEHPKIRARNSAGEFVAKYDVPSFNPDYKSLPIEFFKELSLKVFK